MAGAAIKDTRALAHENETKIEVILEQQKNEREKDEVFRKQMIKSMDKLLSTVEKIDDRVRQIEIKQAEGDKG